MFLFTKNVDGNGFANDASFLTRGTSLSAGTKDGFQWFHNRLPLQASSKPQPVPVRTDKLSGHEHVYDVFFVGEYYETEVDEIPELIENLVTRGPFIDWEGTVYVYRDDIPIGPCLDIYVDPLRKRPTFIYKHKDQLIITNTLATFFSKPAENLELTMNYLYLDMFKRMKVPPGNDSPFEEVVSLPAGVNRVNLQTGEFYTLGIPKLPRLLTEQPEPDFGEIIQRRTSPECLTRGFGILLSGGIDSSFILHETARTWNGPPINCFVAEQQLTDNERRNIDLLDENYNIQIKTVTYDESPKPIRAFEVMGTPIDLGSVGPQIGLMESIQAMGFNVALSGDGADEFFGGYKRNLFSDYRYHDIFIELVNYHNLRLDQVMFRGTIELRTPLSALPMLPFSLTMPHSSRRDKIWFREAARDGGLPEEICFTPKLPLKTQAIKNDPLEVREATADAFIEYFESRRSKV